MKILFPYMARWSSAHASRYYHLLMKVAELGHEVFVLQPPSRGSAEANDIDVVLQTHPNVHVITVEIARRFWNAEFPMEKLVKKMYFSFKAWKYIRDIHAKEKLDLLYIYNLPQFIYLFGRRPKVVFDLADDLLGMLKVELLISEKHPVYKIASYCLQWMMDRSEYVICISGPLYEKIHHPKKYLIPNGANFKQYAGKEEQHRNGASLTVGYVGAFEYSMALDQALDASEVLRDVQFILIGVGREFSRIKKAVEERKLFNVTLTGALPHSQAMEYVERMDICLNLFNKTDVSHAVSPLKLFEYLSFKKPVISTRLHEVERINKDFLYFADTAEEVAEQIVYISSNLEEAKKKAEQGYAVVSKEFSWEKIAKDFLTAVLN